MRNMFGEDREAVIGIAFAKPLGWQQARACSLPASSPAALLASRRSRVFQEGQWLSQTSLQHQGTFCYNSCKVFPGQNTVTWSLSLTTCKCSLWRGWTEQAERCWFCLGSSSWYRSHAFFWVHLLFFFFKLFMTVLGLHCCVWAFSSCSEWGLFSNSVNRLLIAVASLIAKHGLCNEVGLSICVPQA